jgi:hypothetical protein
LTEAKTASELLFAGFPAKIKTFCRIFAETSANFPSSASAEPKPKPKIDYSVPVIRKNFFDFKLRLRFRFLISPLRLLFTGD